MIILRDVKVGEVSVGRCSCLENWPIPVPLDEN